MDDTRGGRLMTTEVRLDTKALLAIKACVKESVKEGLEEMAPASRVRQIREMYQKKLRLLEAELEAFSAFECPHCGEKM